MEKPLVSIIMGAYNCEATISSCIDSVRSQTYENWEFIICDDCSTDATREILLKYQESDKRIKVFGNEKNMRLAASLNRCLAVAKGRYIARMDADDECMPTRLERQVEFLMNNPEMDVVGCNMLVFDECGQRGIRKSQEYPKKEVLLKTTPFAHPTIMMKKEVYDILEGYTSSKSTMRAEDLDLWFRFYEKGFQGYNLQETLYKYREGKDDLKKRSLKAAFQTAKVYWEGYKRLKIKLYLRIWVLKPIVAAIIPNKLMMWYHSRRLSV